MPERIVRDVGGVLCARQSGLYGLRQVLPGWKILQEHFSHAAEVAGFAFHEKEGRVRAVLIPALRQSEKCQPSQTIEHSLGATERDARAFRNSLRRTPTSFQCIEDAV